MTDLQQYGYVEADAPPDGLLPGRVMEFRRNTYCVMTQHGETDARLAGAFVHNAAVRADLPCVGDFVWLRYGPGGVSVITKLLPRRTKFSRSDGSGHGYAHIKANREQVVAANFDYVFIMTSLNRDFRISRILRYLTQARASGGQPVVVLTKADLCDDVEARVREAAQAAPEVPIHAISAHSGFGLGALGEYVQPMRTIVFLGMSGVGKSSLVNALAQADIMAVREVRRVDASKGSHTTTHRQLLMLPCGAMLIDTPGMRELGLFDAGESIAAGFADVEDLLAQCRFSDCGHDSEPGCAVRAALADGSLPRSRWEQYRTQMRGNTQVDVSSDIRARQHKKKAIAKGLRAGRRSRGGFGG